MPFHFLTTPPQDQPGAAPMSPEITASPEMLQSSPPPFPALAALVFGLSMLTVLALLAAPHRIGLGI